MSLPLFTERVCAHRGACAVCRDRSDTAWHAAMVGAFQMPAGTTGTDIACPIGLPMGSTADEIKRTAQVQKAHVTVGSDVVRQQLQQRTAAFHALWEKLHTATAPDTILVSLVSNSLPCGECTQEFVAYIAAHPPDFSNWERWVLDLHNAVNQRLGRKAWTIEQARERWPTPPPI